ncbi:helix-turn-helix domain-containing protein [Kineococcus sp. G2]|uniref:helix-turn-helix domain-containing protein n=1 Tax=Kineococcus sp. G2 TaxID=3127484 RepID=UPI003FA5F0BA
MDADVLLALSRARRPLSGAAVARLAGRSHARTRSCLHRLVEHGLLLAEDTGPAVLYRLNPDHVLAGPDSDVDLLLVRSHGVDPDGAWGEQVHRTGSELEALTGNAVQFVQVTDHQFAEAVRQDQPLVASLREDGRVLVGLSLSELLLRERRRERAHDPHRRPAACAGARRRCEVRGAVSPLHGLERSAPAPLSAWWPRTGPGGTAPAAERARPAPRGR